MVLIMKIYLLLVLFATSVIFSKAELYSQEVNFSCEDVGNGVIWCDDFEDGVARYKWL
jgi:hypothetical protein